MWIDDPEKWPLVAQWLRNAGEFGLDTETHGQPDKTSPQHRARVHCWSVGVLTETRHPRGYRRAVGRVLPLAALKAPCFRDLLGDPSVVKVAHNSPHDRHACENEGVEVRGLLDTLQWARVAVPGMRDYGLKAMEQWALGYPSRPEFRDMMAYEAQVIRAKRHREQGCICGAKPCRKKKTSDWLDQDGVWRPHLRVEWLRFTPESKTVRQKLAVTDFVPKAELPPLVWLPPERPKKDQVIRPPSWWTGSPIDRMAAWWAYVMADAIRGVELFDWLRNVKAKPLVYPWLRRAA